MKKVLERLTSLVQMEIELGAVEFCTFEDMCFFARLFYLGEKEAAA